MSVVVTTIVEGMQSYKSPDEIVKHLVEGGMGLEAAEQQMKGVVIALQAVSQGSIESPDALHALLVQNGIGEGAAATTLEVLDAISRATHGEPGEEDEGDEKDELGVETVVETIVQGIVEGLQPDGLIPRLVALGIPGDMAEGQIRIVASVLQIAAGGKPETVEEYLRDMDSKGVPGVVLSTAVHVLERLAAMQQQQSPPPPQGEVPPPA
jgi:hypothetical protein